MREHECRQPSERVRLMVGALEWRVLRVLRWLDSHGAGARARGRVSRAASGASDETILSEDS